jgi:hypothetical protein
LFPKSGKLPKFISLSMATKRAASARTDSRIAVSRSTSGIGMPGDIGPAHQSLPPAPKQPLVELDNVFTPGSVTS